MFDHSLLPTEIWLEIIDWATYNPNISQKDTPFSSIPDDASDPNLAHRATLAAVCRTWNAWVIRKLYKDVTVARDPHTLLEALRLPRNSDGLEYGQIVHRIVLPYDSTITTSSTYTSTLPSLQILKLCTRIHTLHRPLHWPVGSLPFDYDTESVYLPSLRRLEWWHNMEAERSGGVNSLANMLCCAPSLHYLFIGGVIGATYLGTQATSLTMDQLQTLRLHIRSGVLLRHIVTRWTLPALRRVILDSLPATDGTHILWDKFGNQLELVELGKHLHFIMADNLTECLQKCPQLRELNYYLFFSCPPQEPLQHANLSTVGLHAHVNPMLLANGSAWRMVEQHFEFICSDGLSSLRHINLYGDWRPIMRHPQFTIVHQKLNDSAKTVRLMGRTMGGNPEALNAWNACTPPSF